MAYCLLPGNDITAVELVQLANEHGMYFSSVNGSPRISHYKTATAQARAYAADELFIGGSREMGAKASVARYHGIPEWSIGNRTVSMLIRAHTWGTYVPNTGLESSPTADPSFHIGLGIYYGDSQVSGAYDIEWGAYGGQNYMWDVGMHNGGEMDSPRIDGFHCQYFLAHVDEYNLGPDDGEVISARFRIAPGEDNFLIDEEFSEFHVSLSVLYVVQ